jgi:hypothetical protein
MFSSSSHSLISGRLSEGFALRKLARKKSKWRHRAVCKRLGEHISVQKSERVCRVLRSCCMDGIGVIDASEGGETHHDNMLFSNNKWDKSTMYTIRFNNETTKTSSLILF